MWEQPRLRIETKTHFYKTHLAASAERILEERIFLKYNGKVTLEIEVFHQSGGSEPAGTPKGCF